MLADTHCHLDFDTFDDDRDQALARSREAGVTHILDPGIDLVSSRAAVELAESRSQVYAAVGVHPNEANTWDEDTLAHLRILAQGPTVVAIGEIGLDYYRDRAPRELQKRILQSQLTLATELQLPVVIHNRQATAELLDILSAWSAGLTAAQSSLAERPGVLHSYSDDMQSALRAIELNFYIGITGPVTFRNAPDLQNVVAALPLDRLIVETDAPFLAPHPYRGKRNEPAYVRLIADKIAQLHKENFEAVAQTTSQNARRLFDW
ncbi:MAG TPA: TatD family hydrolase [Anaerolineales bacterium]